MTSPPQDSRGKKWAVYGAGLLIFLTALDAANGTLDFFGRLEKIFDGSGAPESPKQTAEPAKADAGSDAVVKARPATEKAAIAGENAPAEPRSTNTPDAPADSTGTRTEPPVQQPPQTPPPRPVAPVAALGPPVAAQTAYCQPTVADAAGAVDGVLTNQLFSPGNQICIGSSPDGPMMLLVNLCDGRPRSITGIDVERRATSARGKTGTKATFFYSLILPDGRETMLQPLQGGAGGRHRIQMNRTAATYVRIVVEPVIPRISNGPVAHQICAVTFR